MVGYKKKHVALKVYFGLVVQLDRMADSGSVGWGFESLRGHLCFACWHLSELIFFIGK